MNNKTRMEQFKTFVAEQNWLLILLATAVLVVGIAYIWQVNRAATRGFAMRDLEKQVEELHMENDRLQMEVARLRSVASVSHRIQMLGLTPVESVEYVTETGSVALNR